MLSLILEKTGFAPEAEFNFLLEAEKRLVSQKIVPIPTADTKYRISGLSKMCPREQVLRARYQVEKKEIIDAKLQRVFDFGHAFHSMIQNEWFGRWGWQWGSWKCDNCPTVYTESYRPEKCKCGSSGFVYVEPVVADPQHNLTGHCDGIIKRRGQKYVVEFKTANSQVYQFLVKNQPLKDHVDQINLYMHYLGIAQGFILYFNKDDAAWKVFPVKLEPERVRKLLRKIEIARKALSDPKESIPLNEMCSTADCSRAKVCSTRKLCFN